MRFRKPPQCAARQPSFCLEEHPTSTHTLVFVLLASIRADYLFINCLAAAAAILGRAVAPIYTVVERGPADYCDVTADDQQRHGGQKLKQRVSNSIILCTNMQNDRITSLWLVASNEMIYWPQ